MLLKIRQSLRRTFKLLLYLLLYYIYSGGYETSRYEISEQKIIFVFRESFILFREFRRNFVGDFRVVS
jgi:hypothetical protein